ncbi:MAG: YqzM family protein [Hydrogenibacillus schlegelii]|nr:YqzM family protein [Hydrogenibacillus schlegelii]
MAENAGKAPRVREENDLYDAIVGFLVAFGFFFGLGLLAMILKIVLG